MIRKHVFSFKNAFNGLFWIFKTQSNFRIHAILSLIAVIGGMVFKISSIEFFIIFAFIGIGLAVEALNTAIEEAIDAIHKDWSEEIKIAKDVSAAAMLIIAISALLVACIIFIPKIFQLFSFNF